MRKKGACQNESNSRRYLPRTTKFMTRSNGKYFTVTKCRRASQRERKRKSERAEKEVSENLPDISPPLLSFAWLSIDSYCTQFDDFQLSNGGFVALPTNVDMYVLPFFLSCLERLAAFYFISE